MATSVRRRAAPKHTEAPSPSKRRKPNRRKATKRRASSGVDLQTTVDLPRASRTISPVPSGLAERPPPPLAAETIMDTAFNATRMKEATAEPTDFPARVSDLSAAAFDHLARCGYAAVGGALRVTSRNACVAAQTLELVGVYAASAGLANKLAAQAVSCSREFALLTLGSQTDFAQLIGNLAVAAATTPLRIAAFQSA
jgi:hypothetical protein